MDHHTTAAPSSAHDPVFIDALRVMANRIRKHSMVTTTEAASGHPSTCLSAADLTSALFFHTLRFDVPNPSNPLNDRFVLSKGHGVPAVWAAWAEAGAFPVEHLLTLRNFDSDLEGHPTPRCAWADVATGSLGQGLSIGVGMAISSKMDGINNQVYVMTGDGELAEGSVWEAAMLASHRGLDNITAILDINRYGQSEATMYGGNVQIYAERMRSFGWTTEVIDGHDMDQIVRALDNARSADGPYAIVASTLKGKGVGFMEDKDGWHGKPVPADMLADAVREVGGDEDLPMLLQVAPPTGPAGSAAQVDAMPAPDFDPATKLATRQAYGKALATLGHANNRVVALDGDTKNSTYSQALLKEIPERFVECFIAEQNMVGVATGLAAMGKIPFASTFACFLTRAYDQIRMGAISQANIKLCGSHCGVSIGPDGPSQMGLEDIAMMRAICGSTVLYPSDAVSTQRMVELAAQTEGIVYIRTTRPKTVMLYATDESFRVGGSHVLKSSDSDHITLVSAGITLHEALKAAGILEAAGIRARVIDLYSVKPVDAATLRTAVAETGALITIEDHYADGGIADAVLGAVAGSEFRYRRIAVEGLPRSGDSADLMNHFGLTADAIADAARQLLA